MIARGGPTVTIGMSRIKQRRLSLPVHCHGGDCVGDYVPFYLCPRSVMLYLLHQANHPELAYRGGQDDILHLEADLREAVAWAEQVGRRWAFTSSNAGATYARFHATLDDLDQINWRAVAATDWRAPDTKEGKQAEFLVHDWFPVELIARIGVRSIPVQQQAFAALAVAKHRPPVVVMPGWYY